MCCKKHVHALLRFASFLVAMCWLSFYIHATTLLWEREPVGAVVHEVVHERARGGSCTWESLRGQLYMSEPVVVWPRPPLWLWILCTFQVAVQYYSLHTREYSWLLAAITQLELARMACSCCLCCNSLHAVDHRRKKLHGKTCNDAKQTLSRLSPLQINTIPEFSNSAAILCWQCEKKLKDINSLELKLESIKAEIQSMISMLSDRRSLTSSRVPSTPVNLLGKRHGTRTTHENPPYQRVWNDPGLESAHDSVPSVS